jgi:hypothetical protein
MLIQEIRRKIGVLGKDDVRDNVPPIGDVSKPQMPVGGEGLFCYATVPFPTSLHVE